MMGNILPNEEDNANQAYLALQQPPCACRMQSPVWSWRDRREAARGRVAMTAVVPGNCPTKVIHLVIKGQPYGVLLDPSSDIPVLDYPDRTIYAKRLPPRFVFDDLRDTILQEVVIRMPGKRPEWCALYAYDKENSRFEDPFCLEDATSVLHMVAKGKNLTGRGQNLLDGVIIL